MSDKDKSKDSLDEFLGLLGTSHQDSSGERGDYYKDTTQLGKSVQWAKLGDDTFTGSTATTTSLPAGTYKASYDSNGRLLLTKMRTISDKLIHLPDTSSEEVITSIKQFWGAKEKFRKKQNLFKRGVLIWGPAGCHPKGVRVQMYDGTTKNVENIEVGDKLIGPDYNPRTVYELCTVLPQKLTLLL